MVTERVLRKIGAALLVLLLVPLIPVIGVMVAAAVLIAKTSVAMSGGLVLCIVWAVLTATVFGTLILLLTHDDAPLEARSPGIRRVVAAITGENLSGAGMRVGMRGDAQDADTRPDHHIAFEWWQRLVRMASRSDGSHFPDFR